MSKQTLSLVAISAILGWTQGFETTEHGIHLQAEEAETLEQHIASLDAQVKADKQSLADAQTKIDQLSADLQSEKDTKVLLEANLKTAQEDAATQKALAEKYGAKPSGNGTTQEVTEDPPPITADTTVLDPVTAAAKKIAESRSQKK